MPVFSGRSWQRGHRQVGKGLGGFLRGIGRATMPFIKSQEKPLGQLALNTGLEVLKDVSSGKSVKQALKSRGKEGVKQVKDRVIQRFVTFGQTGRGKTRRGKKAKKRKASTSTVRPSDGEQLLISSVKSWPYYTVIRTNVKKRNSISFLYLSHN